MVLGPWRSIISEDGTYYMYYIRQVGYVTPGVCFSVCLSVSNLTYQLLIGS